MSTIDYLGLTDRNGSWGDSPTGYFGQTFVATGTNLASIEFEQDLVSLAGTFVDFTVIVAKYSTATGFRPTEILWESDLIKYESDGTEGTYQTIEVKTGGLTLEPGETYVFLLNSVAGVDGGGYGYVAAGSDGPYADGFFVSSPGGGPSLGDPNRFWLTAQPNHLPVLGDMAFRLTFGSPNAAPVAVDDTVAADEDGTVDLWATLLANDSDADAGDTKLIQSVDTTGLKGSVVFDATTQTLKYVADADVFDLLAPGQTATDTFTYTIVDQAGATAMAAVTVTITGTADGRVVNGTNKSDLIDASYANGPTAGEDTIYAGNGDDVMYALAGADTVWGGSGKDQVFAGSGIDTLYGENGDDLLDGGLGGDLLDGGRGNDVLIGGAGNDTLAGGEGQDRFVFAAGQGAAGDVDIVADFGAGDRVVLQGGLTATVQVGVDATGDGIGDTVLELSDNSTVVLSGFTAWSAELLV
jgi:VCBS repeat-containing protein